MPQIDNDTSYPVRTSIADTDQFSGIDKTTGTVVKWAWSTLKTALNAIYATFAATVTDNRIIRGDGSARGVQSSAVTIDDSGNVTGVVQMTGSNVLLNGTTAAPIDVSNTRATGYQFTFRSLPTTPAVGDVIDLSYNFKKADATEYVGALRRVYYADPTTGSMDTEIHEYVNVAGTLTLASSLANGLQIGAPTGGYKGTGTINAAGDIYKNNTAYTNPDWVLEQWVNGKVKEFAVRVPEGRTPEIYPLPELKRHITEHLRLPGIGDAPAGMFERGDIALEWIERLVAYAIEADERIARLEAALSRK